MAKAGSPLSDIEWLINPAGELEAEHGGKIIDLINPLAPAEASGYNAVGGVSGAASDVNDFLSRLSQPNTWLRVGEFFVGAILIYVGLRSMFPSQIEAVTGPVKTAAKVVK
jgi:hypothetical protein